MRRPRQVAKSGIYHVIARGAGRQNIFEDDIDRSRFLDDFARFALQKHVQILAWCLMSNHVHLLLEGEHASLSSFMQILGSEYAQYFNLRHDRVGPLFQSRFKSEPVETDEYLITVLCYIHNNPVKAGIATAKTYNWSSYTEYVKSPQYCHTSRVLAILGSKEEFVKLHGGASGGCLQDVMEFESLCKLGKDALIERAIALLGENIFRHIKEIPIEQRNQAIDILRKGGMSVRQIERITGIGRGIVGRRKCDKVT